VEQMEHTSHLSASPPHSDLMEKEDTTAILIQAYLTELQHLIGQLVHYPIQARSEGIEGHVSIRLTIELDGTLSHFEIVDSSGSKLLERAVVKAIKKTSSFPKPPHKGPHAFVVTMPLMFQLEN